MPNPGDQEFTELRNLLIGGEEQRTREVGEVLPAAIALRAARDQKLRRALEPVFEQTFRSSVRRNPQVLAETLYPVIGAAIRRAVNAALAGLVETLNETLENRFSARSLRWRWEALRSGKSYGEIMLLHSVRYAVEQVFLIHRGTGLLLEHAARATAVVKDADVISGMLTAIQDFVSDSFGAKGAAGLEQMQVGEVAVWVQQGPLAILAGVIQGVPPAELKVVFQKTLESIHQELAEELRDFAGDTTPFGAAAPTLKACLLGQSAPHGKPRRRWAPMAILPLLGMALVWLALLNLRDCRRSQRYLEALRNEPGITVTHADWQGGRYAVYGLRDPLSRDPLELARAAGLPAKGVEFHFEPYQSLSPVFQAERRLEAERENVESMLLRFETGSAVLTGPLLDRLEEMVGHLKALFQAAADAGRTAKLEVTGHTDSTGADDINAVLAVDRAAAVVKELRKLGIPEGQFVERGVGDKQPVRTGTGEREQSFNRSVSFRVMLYRLAGGPADKARAGQ